MVQSFITSKMEACMTIVVKLAELELKLANIGSDQKLYMRSFSGPYLRCVHPKKVQDVLFELHEGSCGSHTDGRSLAHRVS